MQISGLLSASGSDGRQTGATVGFSCGVVQSLVAKVKNYQDNSNFSYDCATRAGSSGSPVLDQRNCVVGLHHGAGLGGVNLGVLMQVLRPRLTNRPLARQCQ